MAKKVLPAVLALILLLSACGSRLPSPTGTPAHQEPSPTVAPTPESTPYDGPVSPLSGLPMGKEWVNRRPVAIMLNNLKEALPQLGQSQADVIYEVPAEGGITRMLAVYQSLDGVGKIGSIRSARPYYLELALGHDAIYIHAGGSEDAYAKIRQWGVTALDGVNGPYMSNSENGNLMWRDPERRKSYSLEHTVVTTGTSIIERLPTYGLRLEHDSRLYRVEEYGEPYVDGESGEQVAVTNVIVLKTACRYTGDSLGHITVDLSSGGTGYFACGGKVIDLTWSKDFPDGQLQYYDLSGSPISFGVGRTYVVIVPLDCAVSFE